MSIGRGPWHLWVVGIVSLLWNAVGAMDYLMTQTRNASYMEQFSPEQLEYFYGFPSWVVATWALAVWGGVAGSLLLLLRRRLSFWVFVVSFASMLITTLYNFAFSNGLEMMGGPGQLAFTGLIFVVAALLPVYASAQRRRAVLT